MLTGGRYQPARSVALPAATSANHHPTRQEISRLQDRRVAGRLVVDQATARRRELFVDGRQRECRTGEDVHGLDAHEVILVPAQLPGRRQLASATRSELSPPTFQVEVTYFALKNPGDG